MTKSQFNYKLIYNTCTCIKPSQILLKLGIKVAIYCTVLYFFWLFFLSAWSDILKQEHFKTVRSGSATLPSPE